MKGDMVFSVIIIALSVVLVVWIAGGLVWFGPVGCEARWEGFDVQWTLQGGCRVLTESGYVPEDSFRVVATP